MANCPLAFSQHSGNVTATRSDTSRVDTNYVKSYKDKLILGLYYSERRFLINMSAQDSGHTVPGSTISYIANSNHITGISLHYDIIGLAFGFRSVPSGNLSTGNTKYLDFELNLNSQRWRLENSFRNYKGFYDNDTSLYFKKALPDTLKYFLQVPSMNLRVIKSKFIYSFNKRKFSLGAAYSNINRQLKSKGSWLIIANFYSLNLHADTSFVPRPLRTHYDTIWDGLNRMNIFAGSAIFGGTYTVVMWKRFYVNFLLTGGFETQYRDFYTQPENKMQSYWRTTTAADFRLAIGFNSKRFYIRNTSTFDINNYDPTKDIKIGTVYYAFSFDVGYRFNVKTPKPYKKFQGTKLYDLLN